MNIPKLFQFTVKHDGGKAVIQIGGFDSFDEALKHLQELEKCPFSAIKRAVRLRADGSETLLLIQ